MKRKRYHIDLSAHIAECEANYARLKRLLPDMEQRAFRVRLGDREPRVRFEVGERQRYTTVLRIVREGELFKLRRRNLG